MILICGRNEKLAKRATGEKIAVAAIVEGFTSKVSY